MSMPSTDTRRNARTEPARGIHLALPVILDDRAHGHAQIERSPEAGPSFRDAQRKRRTRTGVGAQLDRTGIVVRPRDDAFHTALEQAAQQKRAIAGAPPPALSETSARTTGPSGAASARSIAASIVSDCTCARSRTSQNVARSVPPSLRPFAGCRRRSPDFGAAAGNVGPRKAVHQADRQHAVAFGSHRIVD